MKVEVGMKESSKKKLARGTRRWKTGKESRCLESGGETEASKTEIVIGYCIKSDLERVEEEWKK